MIGLEGSGFTICLGVILLLTGIVMYYCKSKITQNEHKINSMFKLVTALHEEVNQLKAAQQHQQTVASNHEAMQNQESWNQTSNFSEEPQESSMNEETPMPTSFLNHPYEELIPPQLSEELEESEDSQSETDNEENLQLNLTNDNSNSSIKVVDLGEIEELQVIEESDEEQELEETDDSDSDAESPVIDYTKMQVAALKKIVSERKLATNVARLKKKELLNLLQA